MCVSMERHYNVGVENDAKLTFSRSDSLKTTTVTPFLLHFLIEGAKIYNIGKYE